MRDMEPFFAAAFGGPPSPEKIVAMAPHELDVRMLVQQSLFTIHGTARDLAALDGAPKFVRRLDLAASAKERILLELALFGIDRFHLFPDLTTLAAHVGRIHTENRPDASSDKK
jgi:hypothetical protein